MEIKCLSNPNNKTVDFVMSTLPWTETFIPLMAPAVLKPIIESVGLTSLCIDLNAELAASMEKQPNFKRIVEFFLTGKVYPDTVDFLEDMIESTAQQMLSWKPKYIGLSLFSYLTREPCRWLCYYIKKISPDTKILVGGAGCLEQFSGPGEFVDELLKLGLIDYHIRGDGEIALAEFLKGNHTYPGINSPVWHQLNNEQLQSLPLPDYQDYDFSQYKKRALGVHGSRGCVRACTFCDFITNWTKFAWRTAESIFNEMMTQYLKYGIRYFKFHDTLTNGNLKEFNKLIKMLADWNNANPENSFSWTGYYIFREKTVNDDEMWKTLAESGAERLMVGVENLNKDLRYALGKKFSNESIDYHLMQAQKYRVKMQLLLIVGYIGETEKHIDFAKQWLIDHTHLRDIIELNWGNTLGIFPNTYLDKHKEELGIKKIGDQPCLWISADGQSTPAIRAQWELELIELSKNLDYYVATTSDQHFVLEMLLNDK